MAGKLSGGTMQLPLHLDAETGQSLKHQIFQQIKRLIEDGRLKSGMRLPASRIMASDLGVSRNTVVLAYEQLVAEGYLEMRPPLGTFVSSALLPDCLDTPLPVRSAPQEAVVKKESPRLRFKGQPHIVVSPYEKPAQFDFWVGRPDARLFPILDWVKNMRRRLRYLQEGNSGYGHPAGLWELRRAIAQYVGAARGIKADATDVLIVNGIQEGLSILSQLFVREGTGVVIEHPCYLGAANVFASHGAQLIPVPVDDEGMRVDDMPEAALAYLTPSHQYPTGATLSMARRARVLDWAQRHQSYILEDDYDSDFYYDHAPLPALKSQDESGRVVYMGTFSKSLGAGLRVGYLILPADIFEAAMTAKGLLNNCSTWLIQALLADFLESGAYRHHLRRIRTIYAGRRNALVSALGAHFDGGGISGAQSGMHLVWKAPASIPVAFDIERKARDVGVGVYGFHTGNSYLHGGAVKAGYARTLMLGYAALSEPEIHEGIRRLARALD